MDSKNGCITLKVFYRTVFVPGIQVEDKESQGGRNTRRHVHAFRLSKTLATVSDSEMMTHPGVQFHVLERTGMHAGEAIMRSHQTCFSLVCPLKRRQRNQAN